MPAAQSFACPEGTEDSFVTVGSGHFFLRVRRLRGLPPWYFSAAVPCTGATRSPSTCCAGGDCRYAIARSKYSMSSRALPSVCLLQRKQRRRLTRPVL